MKKLYTIFLVLLLIVIGASAFAAGADGQGDLIARNAELAAFMDDNGNIFVSGVTTPVNTTKAASIVSIDPYRVIFFAEPGNDITVPDSRLISLSLSDFSETIITDDASAACIYEDEVFFISKANPTQLKKYGIDTKATDTAFSSFETMQGLYANSDGVVINMVEGTGAYIYDSVFNTFTAYNEVLASEIGVFDGFEVFLTDGQALMLKEESSSSSMTVDTSVKNWAVIDDTVYYICGSTGNLSLRSYNVSNALWDNIMLLPLEMEQQLTASNNSLFLISGVNYTVYTLDTETRNLKTFATLPSLSSYALGNGKVLTGYRIEAVSGQLNIYGKLAESNAGVMFNFVDFTGQAVRNKQNAILLSAYPIKQEDTVWDLLQPAKQYTTLRKGSRGEAVSAIQQPLTDKGYYDYYIDGVFGWRTERAIELLQADLGHPVTGIADAELQKIILSNKFAAYDPYRQLTRGDRGMRVQEMQQRLRDLGYLADDADAIYGPRTQKAVALFQEENNLRETGTADANTLKKLFSDTANVCSSYIDLQYGDSGYRVRELNNRLKKLYYLEGKVGSTYNSATRAAVKRFQQEVGLKQSGTATVAVQQKLFSKHAPEYSGYITLQRGDDNARVKKLQRRLSELGYYTDSIDGYFGKNTLSAVKKFQRAVGLPANGIADPETKREIYAGNAPHYKEPAQLGLPYIELSAFSKYENGIYQIADVDTVSGFINASWYAEGPVASFDMILKDDRGTVYMQNYGLSLDQNIISIPVSTLSEERTYTITVTANPDTAYDSAPTSDSIQFIRILEEPEPEPEEIGKIGKLIISPVGSDIVRESGVYLIPGDELSFNWSADGSVSGYMYTVTDANGTVIFSNNTSDDTTEFTVQASALSEDSSYTLTVYAVPTNGTIEDSTIESINFKPYTAPVTPPEQEGENEPGGETEDETTSEPFVPPMVNTPALGLEPCLQVAEREISVDGATVIADVYEVGDENFILTWDSGESASRYNVVVTDSLGNQLYNESATVNSLDASTSFMTEGEVYTLTVTAYCAKDETITTGASLYFALPQPETAEETDNSVSVVIGAPTISFDPCTGDAVSENGVEFALIGESESLLISWFAEGNIRDYEIVILDKNNEEMSTLCTESASATLPTGYLTRDEIYLLKVTATAAEDNSVTSSASAYFCLPSPMQVTDTDDGSNDASDEVVISKPHITFDPVSESSGDNSYVIPATDELTISWSSEGNIAYYEIVITDDYMGSEVMRFDTTANSASFTSSDLEPGVLYYISVTAYSADDPNVSITTEECFGLSAAEEDTGDRGNDAPQDAPIVIGGPQLFFDPETGLNDNGVHLIPEVEQLSLHWYAEGSVGSYQVVITDANGDEFTGMVTESASAALPTAYLNRNEVYTLSVTAVSYMDANYTSFATADFMIPADEAQVVSEEAEYVSEEDTYVVEEEYVDEEPEYTPVSIGTPIIYISPCSSTETGAYGETVYLVDKTASVYFDWTAEGNVDGYQVQIIDEYNSELVNTYMYSATSELPADYLQGGVVYTINVTAVAAEDNSVTSFASAAFKLPESESEYVPEEPEYVYEEEEYIDGEEYVYEEEYVEEEPEYVPEEEEYIPEEPEYVPEPVWIGEPVIEVNPNAYSEIDDMDEAVYYLEASGEIEFSWYAEGNIGEYEFSIYDEALGKDGEMVYCSTYDSYMIYSVEDLLNFGMNYDTVYRIYVTAYAADDASVTSYGTAKLVILNPEAA